MKTAEEILGICIFNKFDEIDKNTFIKAMKMYSNQKLDECASKSKEMIYESNEEIKSLNKEGFIMRKFQHTYATPKQLILSLKDEI